uniref:(northern house mosquito) hypothetical protein n=1 Tax=Culex pipiens TaxID=7175 RepID=A0A8D8BSR3_CULPI
MQNRLGSDDGPGSMLPNGSGVLSSASGASVFTSVATNGMSSITSSSVSTGSALGMSIGCTVVVPEVDGPWCCSALYSGMYSSSIWMSSSMYSIRSMFRLGTAPSSRVR